MDPTQITFRAAIEPVPSGECPADINALIRHIEEKLRLIGTMPESLIPFTVGSADPGPDARDRPWMKMDGSTGTFIGFFAWNANFGLWERAGAVGERITKQRVAGTLAADRAQAGLDGPWKLADGSYVGVPNLTTSEAGFFTGSAPDWDTYTVVKTGAP